MDFVAARVKNICTQCSVQKNDIAPKVGIFYTAFALIFFK